MRQQEPHKLDVSLQCRLMQWSAAMLARYIKGSAFGDKNFGRIHVTPNRDDVKRRFSEPNAPNVWTGKLNMGKCREISFSNLLKDLGEWRAHS